MPLLAHYSWRRQTRRFRPRCQGCRPLCERQRQLLRDGRTIFVRANPKNKAFLAMILRKDAALQAAVIEGRAINQHVLLPIKKNAMRFHDGRRLSGGFPPRNGGTYKPLDRPIRITQHARLRRVGLSRYLRVPRKTTTRSPERLQSFGAFSFQSHNIDANFINSLLSPNVLQSQSMLTKIYCIRQHAKLVRQEPTRPGRRA